MTSETKADTLSAALVRALGEIGGAAKDKINPHFKSKYADLGSVIEAIKPVLAAHDLGFTQHCQPSEDGVIVETVLHHAGGKTLSMGSLYVPANKRDAQGFGSAQTYARRYSLQTAFGVAAEDDDGNAASNAVNDPEAQPVREKVPGIQKIKTAIRDMKARGGKADSLDEFDYIVGGFSDEMDVLEQAQHEWWTGKDREGNEFESIPDWIDRRRLELTQESVTFQLLMSTLAEVETVVELQAWLGKNGDVVDGLDGEESRRFQAAYEAKENELYAPRNQTVLEAG